MQFVIYQIVWLVIFVVNLVAVIMVYHVIIANSTIRKPRTLCALTVMVKDVNLIVGVWDILTQTKSAGVAMGQENYKNVPSYTMRLIGGDNIILRRPRVVRRADVAGEHVRGHYNFNPFKE
jgi:hypothetical protein